MAIPFDYSMTGSDEIEYLVKVNAFEQETGKRLHVTIFNQDQPVDQVSIDYNSTTKDYEPINEMGNPHLYGTVILMLDETMCEWK